MTQSEFLNGLKSHLSKIPKDEREKIVEYYSEIINDKIDEGKTEEQAVSELGSPEQVAQSVLEDYSDNDSKHKENQKPRSVGAIIGFSILIPFVILMVAVLGVVSLSFIIASGALIVGGAAFFISSFWIFFQSFPAGLFQFGIGLFSVALGVFAMYGSIAFGKLYFRIVKATFKKYVSVYGGF
ncbi:MAG: DUF1700 domain-containing protein [Clostridia bacterium]|nr:DUF1700 domain-containing protein [Clostridia bacterium]